MTCSDYASVFDTLGTCDYCGEEVLFAILDRDLRCPDCKEPEEDDEPELCTQCNGSGEGMCDGTRCSSCHGKGTV